MQFVDYMESTAGATALRLSASVMRKLTHMDRLEGVSRVSGTRTRVLGALSPEGSAAVDVEQSLLSVRSFPSDWLLSSRLAVAEGTEAV